MTSKVRRIAWHCHHVSHAYGNITIASGADVLLESFIWLHATNIDLAV
jgi:hypothetical protein